MHTQQVIYAKMVSRSCDLITGPRLLVLILTAPLMTKKSYKNCPHAMISL